MTNILNASERPQLGVINLTADHVWIDLSNVTKQFHEATPALFLDRDGVVVVDAHYIGNPNDIELLPGAGELIHAANTASIPVIIVTNQSGVGRGYFGWSELEAVQNRIEELLESYNAKWDAAIACPHHRDAKPPYQHANHPCRKPNSGMLTAAQEILNLDLARSWIVGDKASDLKAGKQAGLKGGIHVSTHVETAAAECEKAKELERDQFRVVIRTDMTCIWDCLTY